MSDSASRLNPRRGKRRQVFMVGDKIRELRKSRNLTQAELAVRIGVQQSDLCRMETGEYKVSLDTLFRILAIFEINIAEFFQESAGGDQKGAEVLRLWRQLSPSARDEAMEFLRFKSRLEDEDR